MNWKKTAVRTLGALVILAAITAAGGYFYLHSNSFRQLAIRNIIEAANQATGGHTQIGSIDFNFSTLTAHLNNVVVRGTESANAPPLLTITELTVGLGIQSALHRQLHLSELLIDHPVVYLRIDASGKSNTPTPAPGSSSGNTSVFDLAVKHFAITRGEVHYNDQTIPLDMDLYNLGSNVGFDPAATRYQGAISYNNGRIIYGRYSPLPHNFNATFSATPSALKIDSAEMKVASSSIQFHADITNYSNPAVSGNYSVQLHVQDFAGMMPAMKAAGDVSFKGEVHYQAQSGGSFLRDVSLNGKAESESLVASSTSGRVELRKLHGEYRLSNATLSVSGTEADLLGGRVGVDAELRNLDRTPSGRVRTTLRGISLRAAQQAIRRPQSNQLAITGLVDGTADAAWNGNISNVRVQSDLTLHAANAHTPSSSAEVPVEGAIHATYDGAANSVTLRQTTLHIPAATVNADGQVSKHSQLQLHATANDLHQLIAFVSSLRPTEAPLPDLSGSATLDATVEGSTSRPHISGKLGAHNLAVRGSQWKSADASFQADPSHVTVSNGSLLGASRGHLSFAGNVALSDWSYLPANALQARVSLEQISVADLQRVAGVQFPISGDLGGSIVVSGSQLDPKGSGSLELVKARAYDEPVQKMSLNFHADNGAIASALSAAIPAGSMNLNLTYTPRSRAYDVRLTTSPIVLQKLHAVQAKNLPVEGTLTAAVNGKGTIDDPQLTAIIQAPHLEIQQKPIDAIKAEVVVANKQANLDLESQVAQASVRGRAHIDLSGDYPVDASLDTTTVPLDLLLATYAGHVPQGFQGQAEFHAKMSGPLKDKTRLQAHLEIPTLNATYQSLQIGAAAPIRADYSQSVVTLQPTEIRGTGTDLRLQGSIPLAGTAPPNFSAHGSIDAQILRIVSPDTKSSGMVLIDLQGSGSASNPVLQGQIRLQDIAISTPDTPLGMDKLNGVLDLDSERLRVSKLTAEVGGGQFTAGGTITYRPSIQFNLAMQGKSVRLRYPTGVRTVLDTNLSWAGTMQASNVSGRVLLSQLSFTPDFDLATFTDQISGNTVAPAQPGFADTINLQVAVQSKDNLSATSSQVSLEGTADLRASGTAADPVITGRTNLTSGEVFYRNDRFQLQRGLVTFDDPNQTRPILNIAATTTVEQYNLTLNLRGPLDMLTISYSSDPPLATADIINLIARGQTSSELAASSQSTDSMVASQAVGEVGSSIQKLAGISSLQIDPLGDGNIQNPAARIGVQQRVTKNFLFTFSTDVSTPGSEIVQGEYQINKRWSVSVARDQLGGVSVDGRLHTKF